MAEKTEPGFWRGFVWGFLLPPVVAVTVTLVTTIAIAIAGRPKLDPGA